MKSEIDVIMGAEFPIWPPYVDCSRLWDAVALWVALAERYEAHSAP